MKVAIVGAGIVGRLMAWHLCQHYEVHLFSKGSKASEDACSSMAAGMLSPYAELANMPLAFHEMGLEALRYWPFIISSLGCKPYFNKSGTLVLCAQRDKNLLAHFINQLKLKKPDMDFPLLSMSEVQLLEPALKGFIGIHLAEAQLEPRALFNAFNTYFEKHKVKWHTFEQVKSITAMRVNSDKKNYQFDKVIDCRGLGAKKEEPDLRGLRGEIITCFAPHLKIKHTLRLLHPKVSCYVVPRANSHYVIGATMVESENTESIQVQSMLELLSGASFLSAAFLSATIVNMQVGIRPAFPSHMPRFKDNDGVISLNGMFRHGFLFAPLLTRMAASTHFGVL